MKNKTIKALKKYILHLHEIIYNFTGNQLDEEIHDLFVALDKEYTMPVKRKPK